jgi:F-type H+-transporting ATPase subunit b
MFAATIHSDEFWVSVAFVIFLVAVWRPAQTRLGVLLDARSIAIRAELDEAQRLHEEAVQALAECRRKQKEALDQAEQIVLLARAEAELAAEEARQELSVMLERRRKLTAERIAFEEQKAVADVRNFAVDVAVTAASRILAGNLSEARRAELVDQTIRVLPQSLH